MSTFYTGRAAPPGAALPSHFFGQQYAGNRPCNTGADTLPGRPQNSKDALRVDQELAGASYLVHHVGADRLKWGLVGEWRGDRKVNVSGRERTVADILSDPALGGGIRHTMEVLNTLLSDAKLEDLVDALERLDNGAAIKRLGYLMEVLGYDTAAVDWPLTSGFPLLDPSLPSGGSRSTRWGLRINADVSA